MCLFSNGYACFFSKRTEALGLLTGFRGSELGKQNLTAVPRDKNSGSFLCILFMYYTINVPLMGWELVWMFRTPLFLGVIKVN